jgi:hypothetical protein
MYILCTIGPKTDEVTGYGEHFIMISFIVCTPRPILCGDKIDKNEMCRACSSDGEGETCTGF